MNIKLQIPLLALFLFTIQETTLAQDVSETSRYDACMQMAHDQPAEALNIALLWQEDMGGAPARHCEAVSLFNIAEYGEAGARFELIAEDIRVGRGMPVVDGKKTAADSVMYASMLSQAAQAWLMAGELDRANDAASRALSVVKKGSAVHIEILLDRAQILAADEDYDLALEDIDAALIYDSQNLLALLFQAAGKRAVGQYVDAKSSIDRAYAIDPKNPSVLLERSNIAFMLGDKEAARQDLLIIVRDYPDSHAAPSARMNLERMALKELK